MPKYVPAWAYGKYRIVPDQKNIGYWNIQEKGWIFWHRQRSYGEYGIYIRQFSSVEQAKGEIDCQIRSFIESKKDRSNIKNWRKQKPIDYP